jgi:predicted phage terminase large subunit-like protein
LHRIKGLVLEPIVTTKRERVIQARDLALAVVMARGSWAPVQGSSPFFTFSDGRGGLTISYRTPFQRMPAPSEITRYTERPANDGAAFIIQSWDTAAKGGPDNDWSVCTTWQIVDGCQWYLLDLWRGRVDYPNLKAKVEENARRWGAHQVLVEESGTAIGLLDELSLRVAGITGVKPEKDKQTRMSIASAIFEAGQVYFPERAEWLAELEAELFSFPGSRHDDQVDSISQALNHQSVSAMMVWRKLGEADGPVLACP